MFSMVFELQALLPGSLSCCISDLRGAKLLEAERAEASHILHPAGDAALDEALGALQPAASAVPSRGVFPKSHLLHCCMASTNL